MSAPVAAEPATGAPRPAPTARSAADLPAAAPQQRRTQEERSAAMRERLLDATVALLAEAGYAGTTTLAVAERAGVSRGARTHHFPTRGALIGAAVEHLTRQRVHFVREAAARLPATAAGRRAALGLLANSLSGPLYAAALELWVAARSDPELHAALVPVERSFTAELIAIAREHVVDDPQLARHTVDLLLGQGVGSVLVPPSAAARSKALGAWLAVLERLAPAPPAAQVPAQPLEVGR